MDSRMQVAGNSPHLGANIAAFPAAAAGHQRQGCDAGVMHTAEVIKISIKSNTYIKP
jgi:hypothetical protein